MFHCIKFEPERSHFAGQDLPTQDTARLKQFVIAALQQVQEEADETYRVARFFFLVLKKSFDSYRIEPGLEV